MTLPASGRKPPRQYYECHRKDCVLSARTAARPRRSVRAEEIEGAVWEHVAGLLADPDRLLAQFEHVAAEAGGAGGGAADEHLRGGVDGVARADRRLLDPYQADAITLAELSERRRLLA